MVKSATKVAAKKKERMEKDSFNPDPKTERSPQQTSRSTDLLFETIFCKVRLSA